MSNGFTSFLLEQAWAKVIRVLLLSDRRRCLRELVDLSGVSLAGVQDIVRRLEQKHVITRERVGNKVFFSLSLADAEEEFLRDAIEKMTRHELANRAESHSHNRAHAVGWIDESIKAWRQGRRQIRDSA